MGSIPARGDEIFTYIYISISTLWCRGKERRWVPPLNTQCLHNSTENGERSILTLGSLCLPCCMRNTAWICFYLHKKKIEKNLLFVFYTVTTKHNLHNSRVIDVTKRKCFLLKENKWAISFRFKHRFIFWIATTGRLYSILAIIGMVWASCKV